MGQDGDVIYREKVVGRLPWDLALLSPGALGLAVILPMMIADGAPIAAVATATALTAVPTGLMWLLFRTLRVAVSTENVHIQFGVWGPKIPIASITSATAVKYDWKAYGGFGIKYRNGEWIYNMAGDDRMAVRIEWTDGETNKVTLVSSRDPATLAEAINKARRRRHATSTPKVRVAGDAEAHAEVETTEVSGEAEDEHA